jgi:hypothetical protein
MPPATGKTGDASRISSRYKYFTYFFQNVTPDTIIIFGRKDDNIILK